MPSEAERRKSFWGEGRGRQGRQGDGPREMKFCIGALTRLAYCWWDLDGYSRGSWQQRRCV